MFKGLENNPNMVFLIPINRDNSKALKMNQKTSYKKTKEHRWRDHCKA